LILERKPTADPAAVAAQAALPGVLKTEIFLPRDLEEKRDT
jgi:hypothetical protein